MRSVRHTHLVLQRFTGPRARAPVGPPYEISLQVCCANGPLRCCGKDRQHRHWLRLGFRNYEYPYNNYPNNKPPNNYRWRYQASQTVTHLLWIETECTIEDRDARDVRAALHEHVNEDGTHIRPEVPAEKARDTSETCLIYSQPPP